MSDHKSGRPHIEQQASTARRPGTEPWESSDGAGTLLRRREAPICVFKWLPPPESGGLSQWATDPEFCFRNSISRPTYHRLRAEGRGPVEMRPGLNVIRITAEAERDWQRLMQEPREDLETRAVERAVKASEAAVRSEKHISKTRLTRSKVTPPDARCPRVRAKRRAAAET